MFKYFGHKLELSSVRASFPNVCNVIKDMSGLVAWLKVTNGFLQVDQFLGGYVEFDVAYTCVCGKKHEGVLVCPDACTLDFFSFLKNLNDLSMECCCSFTSMEFADDVFNPYHLGLLSKAMSMVPRAAVVDFYADGVDANKVRAATLPKVPASLIRTAKDFSCFDADDLIASISRILTHQTIPNAALVLDGQMRTRLHPYEAGVAVDREMFQLGLTYVGDVLPLDPRVLAIRAGFPIERSKRRSMEQVAMALCLTWGTNAYEYVESIFVHPSKSSNVRKEVANYMSTFSPIGDCSLKMYAQKNLLPPSFSALSYAIEAQVMSMKAGEHGGEQVYFYDKCATRDKPGHLHHGIYGDAFKGVSDVVAVYITMSEMFTAAYEGLNEARSCRRMSVVLDTVFKPCSSIETWYYGNRYSTMAKWKYVAKKLGSRPWYSGSKILAAGCGEHNWWSNVLPNQGVRYIDISDHTRHEVEKANINEVNGTYDVILSDIQVAIDYHHVFSLGAKVVVLKILPSMHRSFSSMFTGAWANKYRMTAVFQCGRLHNGEVLVWFDRVPPPLFAALDAETAERMMRGVMATNMLTGEARRRVHLSALLYSEIPERVPPRKEHGERKIDYGIVRVLKPIVRTQGAMARWATEQLEKDEVQVPTPITRLEQARRTVYPPKGMLRPCEEVKVQLPQATPLSVSLEFITPSKAVISTLQENARNRWRRRNPNLVRNVQ